LAADPPFPFALAPPKLCLSCIFPVIHENNSRLPISPPCSPHVPNPKGEAVNPRADFGHMFRVTLREDFGQIFISSLGTHFFFK